MSSMNKAMVIGRLGKDCEMKFMPSGKAVANFSIATSESWKDKTTGEKQEKTEWHNIVAFDKLAEICGNYLKKGSLAFVEGKLQTRKWTDKNGVDRYTTEILANDMRMLGGKKDSEKDSEKNSEKSEESPSYAHQAPDAGGDRSTVDFDEEIPFASMGNFQH